MTSNYRAFAENTFVLSFQLINLIDFSVLCLMFFKEFFNCSFSFNSTILDVVRYLNFASSTGC